MRIIFLIAATLLLSGCYYFTQNVAQNNQEKHQICQRIESQLHDRPEEQQNLQPSVLEQAKLLRQYRQFNCEQQLYGPQSSQALDKDDDS
jgi:hypothetical protein